MEVFWCHIMPGSIRQIVLEGYPRRYFTFWLVNYVAWMLDINVFSVFSVSYTLLVQFSLQKAHDSIRKAIASISGVSPLRIAHLHVSTQLFFPVNRCISWNSKPNSLTKFNVCWCFERAFCRMKCLFFTFQKYIFTMNTW